jgi:hypothetical protein
MQREVAQGLLPLVNDKAMREALQAYAEDRKDAILRDLPHAKDLVEFGRLQGRLSELSRMASLRDEVLAEGNKRG